MRFRCPAVGLLCPGLDLPVGIIRIIKLRNRRSARRLVPDRFQAIIIRGSGFELAIRTDVSEKEKPDEEKSWDEGGQGVWMFSLM